MIDLLVAVVGLVSAAVAVHYAGKIGRIDPEELEVEVDNGDDADRE